MSVRPQLESNLELGVCVGAFGGQVIVEERGKHRRESAFLKHPFKVFPDDILPTFSPAQ